VNADQIAATDATDTVTDMRGRIEADVVTHPVYQVSGSEQYLALNIPLIRRCGASVRSVL
jgi:hypothetical protein